MSTARLQVSGWFGAAASTHWLASQSAMGVLERRGNAFDAAVCGGFVMQVAEPHFNGPAGDVAIMTYKASSRAVSSICGQGPTPVTATIEYFKSLDLDLVPGTGLLPAVVPGAFDAWMLMLAENGTITLREALSPAIQYAEQGIPVDQRLHDTFVAAAPMFLRYWPTSAEHCFDGAKTPPPVGAIFRNSTLAAVWRRLITEAEDISSDRKSQIEAARAIWSDGFIAHEIDAFTRATKVMDVSGRSHKALLTAQDMSGWRATVEKTLSVEFDGHTVHKCGMWTQGIALLQALNLLDTKALASLGPVSADFVHQLVEAAKLALADRDTHYGLSDCARQNADDRAKELLSDRYTKHRKEIIAERASATFRPGEISGTDGWQSGWKPDFDAALKRQRETGLLAAYGGGEPTIVYDKPEDRPSGAFSLNDAERRNYLAKSIGDTSYLSVADAEGNVVSATPSGGWLQSSPIIPKLGFPLGTRAQMMWLEEGSPSSMQPRVRPRSTLSPTIVTSSDGAVLAVGTPGGDQQEQWQLAFLVRHLNHDLPLQDAVDAPGFHTNHVVNSFFPRGAIAASLVVEDRFEEEEIDALRARGHEIGVVGSWIEGRLCVVKTTADGNRHAAVTRRGGQGLAVAR